MSISNIEVARRELFEAKILEKLAFEFLQIVEYYHSKTTTNIDNLILFDMCSEWLDYYWENYMEHNFIHKAYPDNNRLIVEEIICELSGDIMSRGNEMQKQIMKNIHAEKDMYWYNNEFTQDLPEDYEYNI